MPKDSKDNQTGEKHGAEGRDVFGELETIDLSVFDRLGPIEIELQRLASLMEKLDEQRESTPEEIFEEVHSDYLARRDALETDAEPLRVEAQETRRQLDELLEHCRGRRDETAKARDVLELRQRVGEFEGDPEAENHLAAVRADASEAERALEAVEEKAARIGLSATPEGGDDVSSAEKTVEDADESSGSRPDEEDAEALADASPPEPAEETARTPGESEEAAEEDADEEDVDEEDIEDDAEAEDLDTGEGREEDPAEEAGNPTLKMPRPVEESTASQPILSGATMSISQIQIPEIPTTIEPIVCLVSTDEDDIYYRLEPQMTVGRFIGSGHQIVIEDAAVSRQHARIRKGKKGKYILVDLGSSNGTFVNGDQITERELKLGDTVHFGNAGFEVRYLSDLVTGGGNDRS